MSRKNQVYIGQLSDEIDDYVDSLVQTIYDHNIDLLSFDLSEIKRDIVCSSIKKQCDRESEKQFIPHILQDYGFFYYYLKLPMMDKKLSNSQVLSRWSFKLGKILGRFHNKRREYRFHTIMLLRLRRVQLLRAFDVKCCLSKEPDGDHIGFDGILDIIYDTLLYDRSEIVKNNPHIIF